MTIQEIIEKPLDMSLDDWKVELKRRKGIDRKIRKLSEEIDFEVDSLMVLKDEIGSERWMKHNTRMYNLIAKRDKLVEDARHWC